ncbi:trna modification gtpase [Leptolyngbya sp. Heron Island J]|uniref:tRNA uridine-5-carboxymethylaminomethyl(34) synthesis GTPase MnmE n=1 Tax=Leptolyngbya sp. Heron Island J TaxID=1385935 RepID=UPI0003B960B3|nr:tRNA uridine-5-carboxymethylaminomethyl(34) synthesis GTPase MnmE [Leptolyngbya sp. Heron Island J]ESA36230.1 trna modification gtpase [Leptolyngbya sp. Heron Island J]
MIEAGAKIIQGETIAAIATAIVPQQGSVGIVRLSGTTAITIAQGLFQTSASWESHRILYGYITHPDTQQTIDEVLLLLMQSPRSYTREDVVEFHCHGGIMAVQQVLQLCIAQGARLAEPGEFTLRAFLNGRLDLTQAEGIADLVGAQSPQAAQAALAGIQGKLTKVIRHCRSRCLDVLAEVEARIDFADDLPPLDEGSIRLQLEDILAEVGQILSTAHQGELLRTGLKVAIVGQPNVGKSSLLNAWSRCDRAIVTALPGTTRDVVESQLVVGGIPVQVLDTAGIRDATDQVEQLGIERSQTAAQSADLVLLTLDGTLGWTGAEATLYNDIRHKPHILVVNKVDLGAPVNLPQFDAPMVETAAAQGQGIEDLENAILKIVQAGDVSAANLDLAINQRQAAALTRAHSSLQQVEATIEAQLPLDFWTIDLRDTIHALGEVTGEEMTESMLDEIFSRFCIGK